MRRSRVVGATIGVAILAGGCATSMGTTSSSRYDVSRPFEFASRTLSPGERDSAFAQAVADREGPRVSIAAEFDNTVGSRQLRANFHVDDDAYVLVGHLDADGVLRIAFPTEPGDDGFVRGQHSYHTAQFFAGFSDQYRYRATTGLFRTTQASYDSYDGGLGYVFIIASWRPMHFEQFSTNGRWDSFEVADAEYMRDPRPAIYEFASLLAGTNREAYTVQFARYTDTQLLYSGFGNSSAFGYGYGYCAGYEPLGFAFSPFENRYNFNPLYSYGSSFSYRGSRYLYDAAGDCYRSVPTYGFTYGIAVGSPINTPPSRPRTFGLDGPRKPLTPRVPPGHVMPLDAGGQKSGAIGNADQALPATSPHYRQRGLITADEPATGPVRRQPRGETRPIDERARPSIQEMTGRRGENAHEGSGWSHAQMGNDPGSARQGSGSSGAQQHRERPDAGSAGEPRSYAHPAASDNPRSEPARMEPRSEPRSQPRSEPAPRMEAPPRSSPPESPSASAPRAAPVAPPASSTGSKPPDKASRT